MYSGSTMTTFSGRILGAHQKIDRVAHRNITALAPAVNFPSIRSILHFEGGNGPDAIKRKSPAKDEPWHYFQPFDDADTQLLQQIQNHHVLLTESLTKNDLVRASFEAAWLAHAIVDGLTPAHHYPYEEKLTELRGGQGKESRTTVKAKLVLPGDTKRQQFSNNWKMWGPGGLMTSHGMFEWGVATAIIPLKFRMSLPDESQLAAFHKLDIDEWFRGVAQEVANLQLYDDFLKTGWTIKLTKRVQKELAPRIIRSVTLAWYGALYESRQKR